MAIAMTLCGGRVLAEEALVAVAANFKEVADHLQADFESKGQHRLTLSAGSTGKLFAQIANGAPFDVLLAADQLRPERLEAEGLAVPGSRFTYALGYLTLWSVDPEAIGADGAGILSAGAFRRLAIANPALAPYGVAARQALKALDLQDKLADRIVMGENIGQTFAMVATGNAELGLVARSYVASPRNGRPGSRWDLPDHLYEPIRQDAVLLTRAQDNAAARAFLDYLRSKDARGIIAGYGYGLD